MQYTYHLFAWCLFFTNYVLSTITQKSTYDIKSRQHVVDHLALDTSPNCPIALEFNDRQLEGQKKLIFLIDIESAEDIPSSDNKFTKNSDNLFFIESSGKNHLEPREACAIESAVKHLGISGRIIVAMTSPSIDVLANNATYQIYSKFAERAVFFRHVNIDTIFRTTPLHELHVKGHLKQHEEKRNIFLYRYDLYILCEMNIRLS